MGKEENFKLNQSVALALSGEAGTVSGIAYYADGTQHIQVTYVDGHGCQKKEWWQPHEVVAA